MQQLLLLVAVAATAAAVVSAEARGLGCGRSWQAEICRNAPAEFSFSDGCNTVTCDSRGEYMTTLMFCPEATTDAEKQRCRDIRKEVRTQLDNSYRVTCPLLAMNSVCSTAAKGFTYSDGCNTVSCNGAGSGISTLMWCPAPEKPAEMAACERRTRRVVERLEPRTCRDVFANATQICRAQGAGFRFSDGCNTVECDADARWTSTLKECPAAEASSAICRWVVRLARGGGSGRSGQSSREFPCASLAVAQICNASTIGFRYNDGCNSVHCLSPGKAVSTFRLCEPPSPSEADAAAAYCASKAAEVARKRANSKRHLQCLTAADVCRSAEDRKSFYDGCNYCFCMGAARAGCTRRACAPYFSTDQEFKEECKRRKAGIIN